MNRYVLQTILSFAAIICLVIGWFPIFPEQISEFLSRKLFYFLIGLSFVLMAPTLTNKNFILPMYLAGIFCIVGIIFPPENKLSAMKSIGILTGVAISFISRPKITRS